LPAAPRQRTSRRPGWIHEIKHDGFRIFAELNAGGLFLFDKNSNRSLNRKKTTFTFSCVAHMEEPTWSHFLFVF